MRPPSLAWCRAAPSLLLQSLLVKPRCNAFGDVTAWHAGVQAVMGKHRGTWPAKQRHSDRGGSAVLERSCTRSRLIRVARGARAGQGEGSPRATLGAGVIS